MSQRSKLKASRFKDSGSVVKIDQKAGVTSFRIPARQAAESLLADTNELQYPEWQNPLLEVILELNQDKFVEKMLQAEAVILDRLRELRQSSDSHHEKEAISRGLTLLKSIKVVRLGNPDCR